MKPQRAKFLLSLLIVFRFEKFYSRCIETNRKTIFGNDVSFKPMREKSNIEPTTQIFQMALIVLHIQGGMCHHFLSNRRGFPMKTFLIRGQRRCEYFVSDRKMQIIMLRAETQHLKKILKLRVFIHERLPLYHDMDYSDRRVGIIR